MGYGTEEEGHGLGESSHAVRLGLVLLLVSLMAVMCASVALALDEEAPRVEGPENIPGADVVSIDGQSYLLDARGSTDNVGIVRYRWEITDPTGTTFNMSSLTPTRSWTPAGPGLYKVISWAKDAEGNEGAHVFAVDVVEVVSAATVTGASLSYDHSILVSSGQMSYVNSDIDFTGGVQRDPPSFPTGEMLSEGLTFSGLSDGSLAGSWGPYAPANGAVYEETDRVLEGRVSLVNTGGLNYGFTYTFDNVEDLTMYKSFHAWFQKDFYNGRFYYMEFYDVSGNYLRVQPPTQTNNVAGTWFGVSVSLDLDNVGYIREFGLSDLTAVKEFKVRYYGQRYSILMDCVYFSRKGSLDNMTESATPAGAFGGTWVGMTTGDKAYVGSHSPLYKVTSNGAIFDIQYDWTSPVDLSNFNAMRLFVWYETTVTNGGYARIRTIVWTDGDGDTATNVGTSLPYLQSYETNRYGTWSHTNVPMDHSAYTESGTMDWTRVKSMKWEVQAQRIGDMYLDGLEFYRSKRFTPGNPGLTESLAHGIYVGSGASLSMNGCTFEPSGPFGGFINAEGDITIRGSTLGNLWGTMNPTIPLEGSTWGGVVAMGVDVVLDTVTVDGASSCAFTTVNCDVAASNVTVTGAGEAFEGAVAMAVLYTGTLATDLHAFSLSDCEFQQTAMGAGLHVYIGDAPGTVDGSLDGVTSTSNTVHGVQLTVEGLVGDVTVDVTDCSLTGNGGTGLLVHMVRVDNQDSYVQCSFQDLLASNNSGSGIASTLELGVVDLTASFRNVTCEDNSGDGLAFGILDCSGSVVVDVTSASVSRNSGDGMEMVVGLKPFVFYGDTLNPDLVIDMVLDGVDVTGNAGNGMYELWYTGATIQFPPYPEHVYALDAVDVSFSDNQGAGYQVTEEALGTARVAGYRFTDSALDDNGGCGLQLMEDVYQRASAENRFHFRNTTFNGNFKGVEQQITAASVTIFNFRECVFAGNDLEAISGYTLAKTYRYSHVDYYVHECDLDGPMNFNLDGAMQEPAINNQTTLGCTISVRDCTLRSEFPLQVLARAQYKSTWKSKYLLIFEAKLFFTGNTMTVPSRSNGLRAELWGSAVLEAEVVVEDVVMDGPGNDGIYLVLGSSATLPDHQRVIYGSVQLTNVTIRDPGRYGVLASTATVGDMIAIQGVLCRMTDVTVSGAAMGMVMDGVDTEVRRCTFSDIDVTTVLAIDCTVDLRDSEYGSIQEPNLRAQEAGKIQLWFDLSVRVLWKDSDDVVVGARVGLEDNSYETFGFSEVTGDDPVGFLDLNSIRIVESGTFISNPFKLSTTFLDLQQETYVDIYDDVETTVWLVDDIPPIVSLQAPEDGSSQSSGDIVVKGTAYDLHRTVDAVMVSVDGENWLDAEGTETFTCTIPDVPDGTALVRVRVYDAGDNFQEVISRVFVDTTPPVLVLMTPKDGLVTNEASVKVMAATETGALAYVNQVPAAVEYSLIEQVVDLAEGLNSIEISVIDSLGNTRQAMVNVTLDTKEPHLSVLSHGDWSSVSSESIDLVGVTEPGDVTVLVDGAEVAVSAQGRFETTIALGDGRNSIIIQASDEAGNINSLMLTVFLDQEPPALTVLAPVAGQYLGGSQVLVLGLVEPDCRVLVGGQEIEVTRGQIDTHVSLSDGAHVITVTAVDDAGNERSVEIPVTVDTTSPTITLSAPGDGTVTSSGSVLVAGSTGTGQTSQVTVIVNGEPVNLNAEGGFATEVDLVEGTNLIAVVAVDEAGNAVEVTRAVVRDSAAPFLDFDLPDAKLSDAGVHKVTSDRFKVTGFGELGSTVWVEGIAVDMDPGTGFFSIELDVGDLEGQPATVTVVAIDAAGNTSEETVSVKKVSEEEDTSVTGAMGAAILVIGVLLVLVGIYLLMRYRATPTEHGDEEEVMDR